MAERCAACLEPIEPPEPAYHVACLEALFESTTVPTLDVDLARLHTVGLAMVGHTTFSGVQRKISLGLSADRQTLRVAVGQQHYILKPPSETFPDLPANERLTMRILAAIGLSVPPLALIPLAGGELAYVIRRFDRTESGKRAQEDFCQLGDRRPKDKYRGSAELCARIVKRYTSEPLVELRHLFRRLVGAWLVGDGDLHLKNLSLLRGDDGRYRLSPAYDALCTRLYIPLDRLSLTVRGRDDALKRSHWLGYATDVGLPKRAAARVIDEVVAAGPHALQLVEGAGLRNDLTDAYLQLLETRLTTLQEGH